MRYLSPKSDHAFKHVFGGHPDLAMSLLNALLPLAPGQEIADIEYIPAEAMPAPPCARSVLWTCVAGTGRGAPSLWRCR